MKQPARITIKRRKHAKQIAIVKQRYEKIRKEK